MLPDRSAYSLYSEEWPWQEVGCYSNNKKV